MYVVLGCDEYVSEPQIFVWEIVLLTSRWSQPGGADKDSISSPQPWGVKTHRMQASLITTAHSSQKLAGKPWKQLQFQD
jgi:hypothetical protein